MCRPNDQLTQSNCQLVDYYYEVKDITVLKSGAILVSDFRSRIIISGQKPSDLAHFFPVQAKKKKDF